MLATLPILPDLGFLHPRAPAVPALELALAVSDVGQLLHFGATPLAGHPSRLVRNDIRLALQVNTSINNRCPVAAQIRDRRQMSGLLLNQ